MRYLLLSLLSALLFGAATPASKSLLSTMSPFQLAGLLYLGAAAGTFIKAFTDRKKLGGEKLSRINLARLAGAIVVGGILAPVFLLWGLKLALASSVSLWLNLEMVFTLILGWLLFKEHIGGFGILGAVGVLIASVLLGFGEKAAGFESGFLIGAACLCWGLDNHLTALIDGITPSQSTMWKGLAAGFTNITIGICIGDKFPAVKYISLALVLGAVSYGISIVLYIKSAQQIGASRSQMIFSTSPFWGLVLSAILLKENLSLLQILSSAIFAVSILAIFFDRHAHSHLHMELDHSHEHIHNDSHHNHTHDDSDSDIRHTHWHKHEEAEHSHPHWSDLHHRHRHD
jgi:drug/metabolite transporter (DMT)-like permease